MRMVSGYLSKVVINYDKVVDFEKLKKAIEPGDILLIAGRSRVSKIIMSICKSEYSHIALVGERNEILDLAVGKRVSHVPLKLFRSCKVAVFRHKDLNKDGRLLVARSAEQFIGYEYDIRFSLDLWRRFIKLPDFLRYFMSSLKDSYEKRGKKMICPEIASRAYLNVGVKLHDKVELFAPHDVLNNKNFERVL